MNITFLLSSLWLSGGNRVVVEYANRLSQRGHRVSLVFPKGATSPEITQEISPGVELCEASVPLKKPMSLLDNARLTLSMIRRVPRSDVIIATHTPTTVVSLAAGKLLRRGAPIWFYMDYPGMFSERPIESWLLRHALNWHRGALVLSSHSASELATFSTRTCRFVGLGLSSMPLLKPFPAEQVQEANRERKAIFYLGDPRPRKGLADFLAAAEMVYRARQDIELWVALKEPGEVRTGVPFRYFLHPTVQELAELYATCGLFVSASWYEGFGLPPLEAMACGAPVVLTDSGGVRDFAVDGENCLIVPTKAPEKLAEAMLRVLDDETLAAKFRQNGPVTAQEYTWDKAVDRFEAALRELSAAPR